MNDWGKGGYRRSSPAVRNVTGGLDLEEKRDW